MKERVSADLTNDRPLGLLATRTSMAVCNPFGLTQRLSKSVVFTTIRSLTWEREIAKTTQREMGREKTGLQSLYYYTIYQHKLYRISFGFISSGLWNTTA